MVFEEPRAEVIRAKFRSQSIPFGVSRLSLSWCGAVMGRRSGAGNCARSATHARGSHYLRIESKLHSTNLHDPSCATDCSLNRP